MQTLRLSVENVSGLDNGGPTELVLHQQRASIGRGSDMDWQLPDPARIISGHHCDVTYDSATDSYVLWDRSRNGTFLVGQSDKLTQPHRLSDGDRIKVGHYVLLADLTSAPLRSSGGDDGRTMFDTPGGNLASGITGGAVLQQPGYAGNFEGLQMPRTPETAVNFPSSQRPPTQSAPPPQQQPRPQPTPPQAPAHLPDDWEEFLDGFCRGARLPEGTRSDYPPEAFGAMLGAALRVATVEASRLQHSAVPFGTANDDIDRTIFASEDANPLAELPEPKAFAALFLRRNSGFKTGAPGLAGSLSGSRKRYEALINALDTALQDSTPETVKLRRQLAQAFAQAMRDR